MAGVSNLKQNETINYEKKTFLITPFTAITTVRGFRIDDDT